MLEADIAEQVLGTVADVTQRGVGAVKNRIGHLCKTTAVSVLGEQKQVADDPQVEKHLVVRPPDPGELEAATRAYVSAKGWSNFLVKPIIATVASAILALFTTNKINMPTKATVSTALVVAAVAAKRKLEGQAQVTQDHLLERCNYDATNRAVVTREFANMRGELKGRWFADGRTKKVVAIEDAFAGRFDRALDHIAQKREAAQAALLPDPSAETVIEISLLPNDQPLPVNRVFPEGQECVLPVLIHRMRC